MYILTWGWDASLLCWYRKNKTSVAYTKAAGNGCFLLFKQAFYFVAMELRHPKRIKYASVFAAHCKSRKKQ